MKRVIIYCEGPTEETFITRILAPALSLKNIFVSPSSCRGVSKYSRIRRDLSVLCRSDPSAVITTMLDYYALPKDTPGADSVGNIADIYQRVRDKVETPEHINNNPHTAPSKRILQIHPQYNKVLDGYNIANNIGLQAIRQECKHFDSWVRQLEALEDI